MIHLPHSGSPSWVEVAAVMTCLFDVAQHTRSSCDVLGERPSGAQVSAAMKDPSLQLSIDQSCAGAPWLPCNAHCIAS